MPRAADSAKFIVSALTRPWVTAEKVGHAAVERVEIWLGQEEKSRYDRLVEAVRERLEDLPAHEIGGSERIDEVLFTAQAHFEAAGLTIDDLVRRRLNKEEAVAEQKARFDRTVEAKESIGPICRNHVIPAVFGALFQEPGALADIDLAFKRAVLAQRDEIRKIPAAVGDVLKAWLGATLLKDPVWEWQPGMAESALLQAEFAIVPFEPREELLNGAKQWCGASEPLGVRLYVGPGGMGKTRLLMQLCRDLDPSAWRSGFLERMAQPLGDFFAEAIFLPAPQQVLVVVDYAEDRPDDVALLLKHALKASSSGVKARVALLARGEADWWDQLRRSSSLAHALLTGRITEPAIPVGAIAMDEKTRLRCFENAVAAFARRLGHKPRRLVVRPDLSGEHFGSVLMVHMSALAAVEGRSLATARELHDYILDREARTWERCLVAPKLGQLDVDDVLQAMAMVYIVNGVDGLEEARAVVSRAPRLQHYRTPTIDDLVRLLARLYPRVDHLVGDQDLRVEPIRPDILGERLIERTLERDPQMLDVIIAG